MIVFAIPLLVLKMDHNFKENMKRIEDNTKISFYELKVREAEALAEQQKYRAMELGIICEFVDKEGIRYQSMVNDDC